MRTPFLASKGLLAKYLKLNKPRTQLASSLFDAASQLGFHTVFTRRRATIYSRTRPKGLFMTLFDILLQYHTIS